MHLKELTHRSPLRVFERSLHGGVGRGNIGVVASRAGVGKTGFLTCIALDDLLRGMKVLHVTTSQTVDHVREYYEEMFADLARMSNLEETVIARELVERNRFIRSLNGHGFQLEAFASSLEMLRREADFHPDVVIIEGYDFATGIAGLASLREVARTADAEVWMSMRIPKQEGGDESMETPEEVAELGESVSVVVLLQPVRDSIRIRLLKDHDNAEIADLSLNLDPRTYLVREV